MSRIAPAQQEKWKTISTLPYAGQCKWVLNGFWAQLERDAESVWTWCETFVRLDLEGPDKKGRDGCDLDEFWSHKFLETLGETMTVIEMREKFRKIDADFNKRMSMIEWLAFRFNLAIPDVINAPQGENKEGIARAQAMVDAAQAAVDDMTAKLAASKAAAEEASRKAEDARRTAEAAKKAASAAKDAAVKAKATADAAKKAAEAAWFAEQENKKALEELRAQEAAYEAKKAELSRTKEDMTLGVVRRNKAANELDQLLSEDPLPLRKAKINQAATVKKSERARAAAEDAKAKADADAAAAEKAARDAESAQHAAEEAQHAAESAKEEAVEAARAAEASVAEAEARFQEALEFLEAEKQKGGIAQGDIWWMQREITEKKKYLPASKQK